MPTLRVSFCWHRAVRMLWNGLTSHAVENQPLLCWQLPGYLRHQMVVQNEDHQQPIVLLDLQPCQVLRVAGDFP